MPAKGMGKKAVLFDMDGVLLDSMTYHVRAWRDAMAEFGCSVPEEFLYLHEGAIEPDTAVGIFRDHGCEMDKDRFDAILARQKALFRGRFHPFVRPYPEVPGILGELRAAGWKMALVTSSHRDILESVLPPGIRDLMDHIVTGDRVTRRKPHPDPYLAGLGALGCESDACLVVENAPAGIAAAKAAGLHCVAITTTLAREHLLAADTVLASHSELFPYIAAWGMGGY